MPLLLNIDTSTEHASVCISNDTTVLAMEQNSEQKNHATFIQPAIKKIQTSGNLTLSSIDAVAVAAGPGSYTGLRVGLATAKGICYALNKPLILINTLEVMARASIEETTNLKSKDLPAGRQGWELKTGDWKLATGTYLFSPMIDARRMEVFTALYDAGLQSLVHPTALILNEYTFKEYLDNYPIIFSGSGHIKFKSILKHRNALFTDIQHHAGHLAILAAKAFEQKQFADVAYSEPFYLKEFFTRAKHPNR
jgi:tRNA threonylcarbamoyladenosine biosynthesis protein TsaB